MTLLARHGKQILKSMSLYRVYYPYWDWECYKAGMWRKVNRIEYDTMLKKAISFTGNHKAYGKAMRTVISAWPNTMQHHLTNSSINRKAFIGHCAVSYKLDIPEYIVRAAWKHLTEDQRRLANIQAEKAYKIWLHEYKAKSEGLYKTLGVQVLF